MSKFIITTDSSCDCSIDELKQKNIPVVFYEYTADSKTFVDDMNEVNYKNFYNNMRNGVVYKTSQINPKSKYFDKLSYNIHMVVSLSVQSFESCHLKPVTLRSHFLLSPDTLTEFPTHPLTI